MAAFLVARLLGPALALVIALFASGAGAQQERGITWQKIDRHYVVYQPNGVTGPAPLVVVLHGLRQDVASLRQWLAIEPVADRNGFVVAYPQGIGLRWNYWHGSGVALPNDSKQEIDDVGFVAAVIASLVEEKLADPARVYLIGISQGALLSWTLACERAELFKAVAPLSSAMTAWNQAHCRPERLMPVVGVDGTADPVQRYDGFLFPTSRPVPRLLSVPETMEFWWQQHGCTGESIKALPHLNDGDPTRIELDEWTGCTGGGAVKLYRVENGGHMPPSFSAASYDQKLFGLRSRDMDTAAVIWQEFAALH